jgi:hypothetical protein
MSEKPGEKPDAGSSNTGMTPDRSGFPTGKRLDPNELAALIDGRLLAAERDATLARLSASPDDLEIVADAVAIAEELDDEVPDIRPIERRRRTHMPSVAWWLSAAAAILVVATLPVMMRRETGPAVDGYASLLSGRVALAPGWDQLSWAVTRGSMNDVKARARAIRAGAITTTIDVSVARGDSAITKLANQMALLLADVPGGNGLASTYRGIARAGVSASKDTVRQARIATREMLSNEAFDDGAWLKAANIAAVGHDSAFFAAKASLDQLAGLERDPSSDQWTRDEVQAVKSLITKHDWDAVADRTNGILAVLAAP